MAEGVTLHDTLHTADFEEGLVATTMSALDVAVSLLWFVPRAIVTAGNDHRARTPPSSFSKREERGKEGQDIVNRS